MTSGRALPPTCDRTVCSALRVTCVLLRSETRQLVILLIFYSRCYDVYICHRYISNNVNANGPGMEFPVCVYVSEHIQLAYLQDAIEYTSPGENSTIDPVVAPGLNSGKE